VHARVPGKEFADPFDDCRMGLGGGGLVEFDGHTLDAAQAGNHLARAHKLRQGVSWNVVDLPTGCGLRRSRVVHLTTLRDDLIREVRSLFMATEWPTNSNRLPEVGGGATADAPRTDRSFGGDDTADGGSEGPGTEWSPDRSEVEVGAEDEGEIHRSAVDTVDALLDEVELALARLDDGTYGRCELCGEAIDDGRLAAQPIIRTCGRCEPESGTDPEPQSGSPTFAPGIVESTAPANF
jgi:RNA polymerase-binding transcription factor DksA